MRAQEGFEDDHEAGCGLWTRKVQGSAAVAKSFMDDFSPILDLVKNNAAPWGGLAVGTVSLFLAVCPRRIMWKLLLIAVGCTM